MRPSLRPSLRAVLARASTKQKSRDCLSHRQLLALGRKVPAAGPLKTASAEVFEDAAAVAAGVAMDVATAVQMDVLTGVIERLSRVWPGLRLRVLPFLLRLARRNRTERSSLDRQRDTSRCCFPENRFPSTGDWRSLQ
jgi:hypothetical protein